MSRNVTLAIAVVLVLIVGGWFLTRPKQTTIPESTQPTQTPGSTPQAGTYKYHDHLNPSLTGSVTVQ